MGIHKGVDKPDGDNHLSIFEHQLWALVYSCLYKFHCPVMFNVYGPNYGARIGRTITFFVPRDNPQCAACITYLENELSVEVRAEEPHETEFLPGCEVHVLEFEGINYYLERHELEALSEAALADLVNRLKPKTLN